MTSKGLIAIGASMVVALAIALPVASGASKATVVKVTAGKPSDFKVTNRGALEHDFKIAGKVTKKLKPGTTATLKVTFKKGGKFKYLCTLPGHAAAGMRGTFVVK